MLKYPFLLTLLFISHLKTTINNSNHMSVILSNSKLKIEIQKPGEKYKGSRFDWTGQITQITYKNKHTFCTNETEVIEKRDLLGRGLYNEFGIDEPIGYNECSVGELYPKIGVGMLVRDSVGEYDFYSPHEVHPALFSISNDTNSAKFTSKSPVINGYGFELEKTIQIIDNSILINYKLVNIGSKPFSTNEYIHNFLSINDRKLNSDYVLKFPKNLQQVGEVVNPESKIVFSEREITWSSELKEQFFFSLIQECNADGASWQLENLQDKIGIMESCSFKPQRVNLWGNKHVVSPEIFFKINLKPNESVIWQRKYEIYELD